jgi:phosphopantetheinyl transferase
MPAFQAVRRATAGFAACRRRTRKADLPDDPRLSINMSYSGLCVLITISYGRCVGIDLEYVDDTFDRTTVVSVVCSTAERQALANTASAERQRAFFRLWTPKEALLKGFGTSCQWRREIPQNRRAEIPHFILI